jgi:hypothetical protein
MSQMPLSEFYELMFTSRNIRRNIVHDYFESRSTKHYSKDLLRIKNTLTKIDRENRKYKLYTDKDAFVLTDLNYEISELEKDIAFCTKDFDAIIQIHGDNYNNFSNEVQETISFLNEISFPHFISDRDGTINNYCARYQSSIQSAYNAIWLTQFCRNNTKSATILTSAPIKSPGIMDVNTSNENDFIFAGSKGREFLRNGKKYELRIGHDQKEALEKLNNNILELTNQTVFKKFTYIGSGLQFKFGQTTIARQDINYSIPKAESINLLREIEKLIHSIDPEQQFFRIEDTGKDIEIMLTIKDDSQGLKDFDKGNGVNFINKTLNLQYEKSNCLVCGDTFSDISMATELLKDNDKVFIIFVTRNPKLISELKTKFNPEKLRIVSNPDVLITSLGLFL